MSQKYNVSSLAGTVWNIRGTLTRLIEESGSKHNFPLK